MDIISILNTGIPFIDKIDQILTRRDNSVTLAKNKNLVYDYPMNISAKFDSNLFCGFRKKDENVKFP